MPRGRPATKKPALPENLARIFDNLDKLERLVEALGRGALFLSPNQRNVRSETLIFGTTSKETLAILEGHLRDKLSRNFHLHLSSILSKPEFSAQIDMPADTLDLSFTFIKKLPKEIKKVLPLRRLPEGMGKLVNLRHLEIKEIDGLECLPQGIGRLKSLQTLCKLIFHELGKLGYETREYHTVMSCLRRLVINECHNLKILPHQICSDTLRELYIGACPNLTLTISCLPPLLEKMTLGEDAGELSRSLTVK
ncbi:hypothetical protein GIB67_024263 [Kingdonia uniflora]|uniref:Uncharacterized protein n=1 Tax=Kingdonia uniflora TaxID=39325 RepID=A0A7J7LZY9_9MAGN|nr:hypothetical protein GIB67_024263 [Kingdonia uniflora]